MGKLIHSPEYLELRELPNAARKKARLTQAEVAERPGLPLSFVANYEGGESWLDALEFIQIAQVLGTEPAMLTRRIITS